MDQANSEGTKVPDEQKTDVGTNVPSSTLSVEELKVELERIRSTNERLLAENKKHKAKREQAEQEKMLAEGKKDELIMALQDKVKAAEEKERTIQILDAVAKEAQKRGCDRWDHLYQLTGGNGIEFDDETGSVSGVKEFFDRIQADADYTYFFSSKKFVPTENRTPSSGNTSLVDVDWRTNPEEYLYQVKKKHGYDKYLSELNRLQRERV